MLRIVMIGFAKFNHNSKLKRANTIGVILLTENLRAQNVGRELVFSADLWYNEANEKPPSEREVARRSRDGRSLRDFRFARTLL